MSTRRARIKAVASLPVRRKGQSKETGPAENIPATTDHSVPAEKPEPGHKSPEKECLTAAPDSGPRENAATQRRRTMKPAINIPSKSRKPLVPEGMNHDRTCHEKASQETGQEQNDADQLRMVQMAMGCPEKEAVQNEECPEKVQDKPSEGKTDSGLELGDECSFDPIIPLPGANKNRPKLKPVPKLALRRNSLQGSASEAEDAPCEPPPAAPPPPDPQPAPPSAPRAARPRAPRGKARARPPPPHQALTMYDLIFYNPPNNAIKREVPPEAPPLSPPTPSAEPPPPSPPPAEAPEAAPVPQVKLGANGEIVIDEQSLVIETSEALRSRQRLSQLSVVWDGGSSSSGRGVYGRGRRCREWGRAETLRFYRALHTLGTDFSLMLPLFPGRSRRDLKVKFKKEERQNGVLVDRALMNPLQLDVAHLEEEAALVAEGERRELEARRPTVRRAGGGQRKRKAHKTSLALASIQTDENISDAADKPCRAKKFKVESLSTDNLAREAVLPVFPRGSPGAVLASPGALVPPNVEPGSLVILAGTPQQQELRAYVVQLVRGQNKLCPVELPADVVRAVASQVGVTALAPAS